MTAYNKVYCTVELIPQNTVCKRSNQQGNLFGIHVIDIVLLNFLIGARYIDEVSMEICRADGVGEVELLQVSAHVPRIVDFSLVVEIQIDTLSVLDSDFDVQPFLFTEHLRQGTNVHHSDLDILFTK